MLDHVTLEMSLKPFKKTDEVYMRGVIETVFDQWRILIKDAREISILLWTADGSEILQWQGDLEQEMEWAKYIGGAQSTEDWSWCDPDKVSLHSRSYDYMENPPVFTYGLLKQVISLIKQIGQRLYPDRHIRVGETFDPGPEFARSEFKYTRHREICRGTSMGGRAMVCCYSTLHEDAMSYAGFPEGIPEGTPFGTFFGRQCQAFLPAMGFDYLWLSNGFGFGSEPWSTEGAIFDGKRFDGARFEEVKKNCLDFWKYFRAECPSIPLETRGTNLLTGVDLATDGVPVKDIYEGGFGMLPPPNSPWAALNGDFGLELSGYMSHIAKIPDNRYLFRYYVHDPWWANSPWNDRYEALPHDIYLPMTVCRIDENARVQLPTHLNILSIDNSYGDMPDYCAYEPSMHIRKAMGLAPTALPPVVWVYPFDEYHAMKDEKSLREMFFGDWFIRGALNHGLPMSAVVSTDNFVTGYRKNPAAYSRSILVATVPAAGSVCEETLLQFIARGGKVIFYGSVDRASERFLELVNVVPSEEERYGELPVEVTEEIDTVIHGAKANTIHHRFITCGGGVDTVCKDPAGAARPFVTVGGLVAGTASSHVVWLKGTCSAAYTGNALLEPDDEGEYFSGESLMRYALAALGYQIRFTKEYPDQSEPVIMLSRHDNALMFAVCAADTTVKTRLKFPLGAPLLMGGETVIDREGFAGYQFSKAELKECRVFIAQEEGVVGCHEFHSGSCFIRRRVKVTNLKNAIVRFLAPEGQTERVESCLNSLGDFNLVSEPFEHSCITDENGTYYEARNVTGTLVFSIPMDEPGRMTYQR